MRKRAIRLGDLEYMLALDQYMLLVVSTNPSSLSLEVVIEARRFLFVSVG